VTEGRNAKHSPAGCSYEWQSDSAHINLQFLRPFANLAERRKDACLWRIRLGSFPRIETARALASQRGLTAMDAPTRRCRKCRRLAPHRLTLVP
jgi:hypothetical protein